MSSFNLSSYMQTLVQTQKMDQLEQEVHELREEVTTLWVEVEKLTNLASSLIVQQKPQPLGVQPPQWQHQPLCIQLPRQQAPQQLDTQNHAPGMPVDPIPMRYMDMLPKLLEKKLVETSVLFIKGHLVMILSIVLLWRKWFKSWSEPVSYLSKIWMRVCKLSRCPNSINNNLDNRCFNSISLRIKLKRHCGLTGS